MDIYALVGAPKQLVGGVQVCWVGVRRVRLDATSVGYAVDLRKRACTMPETSTHACHAMPCQPGNDMPPLS